MVRAWSIRFALGFALALAAGPVRASEEEAAERRRALEAEFAPRYMEIAVAAKKWRGGALCREAYERAEDLDPGLDAVIDFDPEVSGPLRSMDRRYLGRLAEEMAALKKEEAAAWRDLAVWCDDDALVDLAVAHAVRALSLVPGPVTADERGVLSEESLGALPEALSLAVLDEHEVYRGKLVRLEDLPEKVLWRDSWLLSTKHFDLRSNVSGRLIRRVGRALESARDLYAAAIGHDVQKRITVWIVATRKQYEQIWEGRETVSPSNIGKCVRDFCGVDGSRTESEVVGVAIHEVAHGYLNLSAEAISGREAATMPQWFHEGFATWCAGYGPGSLTYERGLVDPERSRGPALIEFAKRLAGGRTLPLAEFLALANEGDEGYYYQAHAFHWFWREMEDPDLAARWDKAVKAMMSAGLTAPDRTTRGNEIFTKEIALPLPEIEARFHAWAKSFGS